MDGAETDSRPIQRIDLGPLTGSLGFLLRIAQLQSYQRFYDRFAEAGIKPGEFSALIAIANGPGIRQGVLASALMIKRAHMTKMVKAFEDRGLVVRTVPDDDRRAVELRLSKAGQALVDAHLDALHDHETGTAPGLTPAEKQELLRLLCKLTGHPGRTGA